MHHTESRKLPWSQAQMFDLVADVASYPDFLPWCSAARIRSRLPMTDGKPGDEVIEADLVISFKLFREKFVSRVDLFREQARITTDYLEGPFRHLHSEWRFVPLAEGCEVRFDVTFEFRNIILQKLIGVVFNEAMQRIVRAFEARAVDLYGRP